METIETFRLHLRRPTENDALILSSLWRNELVRAFLGGILSENKIDEKIKALQYHWEQHGFGQWTILAKNGKKVIGLCGPHYSEERSIEISYMFFPQFWGQGFAKEAVIASLDYSFKILNIKAVLAITQEANLRSCHLLEGIGMKHFDNFEQFDAVQRAYKLTQNEWQIVYPKDISNGR